MAIKIRRPIAIAIILLVVITMSMYGYFRLIGSIIYPSVQVDIEADFLSEGYFSELSDQYNQIRSKHRKWYIFDNSKAIASHAILTQMMHDLVGNHELLIGHKQFDLYFETFDQHVKQLPSITEEMHYFRNELNRYGEAPKQLEEMIDLVACGKWKLFSSRYHRYEVSEYDAAYNVKFISSNGRFEAVYHAETGEIVNDPVNMGTYNYAPGSIIPWRYYQHHQYDKVPWKKWGNTNQVSYEEITQKQTRHGSMEQKDSSNALEQLIENKTRESQICQQ
ncbi:hypothetical protein MHZ92_12270 [Sporosarcina sp. ACRSL]|uniref:hypothetical protein n=1 Tax=Sporosarcina sp. ACRSL TaxID=2918215 RepID=UPI001EF4F29A|nr:hypothetical protein [Sporosarcina sp. ACRSL]MCG7344914.1 hypothetical protein [Sporosarcina sp. ACRSL]